MRPVKNRRRIDPRYFLDETAVRDSLGDDLMPLDEAVDTDVGGYLKQKGKQAYSRLGQMVGGHGPSHGGAGIEADELNMFSEDLMDLQSVVYSAAQQSPLDKAGLSKFHSAFLESIRSLAEGAGNLNYELLSSAGEDRLADMSERFATHITVLDKARAPSGKVVYAAGALGDLFTSNEIMAYLPKGSAESYDPDKTRQTVMDLMDAQKMVDTIMAGQAVEGSSPLGGGGVDVADLKPWRHYQFHSVQDAARSDRRKPASDRGGFKRLSNEPI